MRPPAGPAHDAFAPLAGSAVPRMDPALPGLPVCWRVGTGPSRAVRQVMRYLAAALVDAAAPKEDLRLRTTCLPAGPARIPRPGAGRRARDRRRGRRGERWCPLRASTHLSGTRRRSSRRAAAPGAGYPRPLCRRLFAFDLAGLPAGRRCKLARFEVALTGPGGVAVQLHGEGDSLGLAYGSGAEQAASATAAHMLSAAAARPGWLRRLASHRQAQVNVLVEAAGLPALLPAHFSIMEVRRLRLPNLGHLLRTRQLPYQGSLRRRSVSSGDRDGARALLRTSGSPTATATPITLETSGMPHTALELSAADYLFVMFHELAYDNVVWPEPASDGVDLP
jgi:hypothetical protein